MPGSPILEGAPLDYIYDAVGKKHRSPGPYDYVNNVHYSPDGFEAVYTDEGRVTPIYNDSLGTLDSFQYEWVIRDHLGNGRVYFSDLDKNLGISIAGVQEVLQDVHYYPFGLMFEGPFYAQVGPEDKYTYNGKRWHEEVRFYDYGFRWQDPVVARWWVQDPHAESYSMWTPYSYTLNNPIKFIDPDGRDVEVKSKKKKNGKEKITITINAKLINQSGKRLSKKEMRKQRRALKKQIKKSFTVSGENIKSKVKINLSIADDESDIKSSDHAFRIVDPNADELSLGGGAYLEGIADFGGLDVFVSSNTLDEEGVNSFSVVGTHELGHSLNLAHATLEDRMEFEGTRMKRVRNLINAKDFSVGRLMLQGWQPKHLRGDKVIPNEIFLIQRAYKAGQLNKPRKNKKP